MELTLVIALLLMDLWELGVQADHVLIQAAAAAVDTMAAAAVLGQGVGGG